MSERKRRSKLELKFEEILIENKIEYEYETTIIPIQFHNHLINTPWTGQFPNGILIETKGILSDHQERHKYVPLKTTISVS